MKTKRILIAGISALLLMMIFACNYEAEPNLYDPNETGADTPIITTVTPDSNYSIDNITFAGEGVVVIDGESFSTEKTYNIAYFDGITGDILDATETSLRVKVPYVTGDSVDVKVSVQGAFNFGEYANPFKMVAADVVIGGFDDYTATMTTVTTDNDENVYVSTGTDVRMISPDSILTSSLHNSTIFAGISAMKMGPDGYIYFIQSTALSRFTPFGVSEGLWFKMFQKGATDLEFASQNKLFISTRAGGTTNTADIYAYFLDSDSIATYEMFSDMHTRAMRVYDGNLYVATTYIGDDTLAIKNAVWKCEIREDGLSTPQLYANFDEYDASGFTKINAITFSEKGVLYLGTSSGPALVKYDNSVYTLIYNDILVGPTQSLAWGNGRYLYMIKSTSANGKQKLLRVDVGEAGAEYYGR